MSSYTVDGFPVLNPRTPMAFLPPGLAVQVTIGVYILVGTLVVLIWDMMSSILEEYRLVTQHPVRLSTLVYFITRLSALVNILTLVILYTAPVGHCETLEKIVNWTFLTVPLTSLLFFFRVRAMYSSHRPITLFFFFMWLAVLGSSLTTPLGVSGTHIGPTEYCIQGRIEQYVWTAAIVPFVNDTLIFCATAWRLMQNAYVELDLRKGVRVVVFGTYLPVFSKGLLHDGQAYYLTVIGVYLCICIIFFNASIPVVYRAIVGVPNIALTNIMACRVYRRTKLGIYRESTSISSLRFSGLNRQSGLVGLSLIEVGTEEVEMKPPIEAPKRTGSPTE